MMTLFRANQTFALADIKEAMKRQIQQLPKMISAMGQPRKILRYEFPCEAINGLVWLHNNHHVKDQMYWSDRQEIFEMSGLHMCDMIESKSQLSYQDVFEYIEDHLSSDNPRLRFYGGFSFSPLAKTGVWSKFGVYRFAIPKFEIFRGANETHIAYNIALKDIEESSICDDLVLLDELSFDANTEYRHVPKIKSRIDLPSREQWQELNRSVRDDAGRLTCEKVVFARESAFEFDVRIRPAALMKFLKDRTPGCTHFCFTTDEHTAFLGSSPERLYKLSGNLLESEAIAGTAPRGKSEEEDLVLERGLRGSAKNAFEHQCVVDALHHGLLKVSEKVQFDSEPKVLKLKSWQHLRTAFHALQKEGKSNEDILPLMHPSPAVAGSPRNEALQLIRNHEPFERGWYAGPVGYVGLEESEFIVAIRSALVDGSRLSIYAGAGIVQDSKEEDEWQEIENKISQFMKVFDNEN